ncbi:ABC transporter substrate-binding protein [Gryllotalpicola reticulitermitis]|uniref:ABC transporter substrate-binding protein n=1 Tax=Gryllotalpicola reticulitermitis TaxID=1184153 RepID=A0ABV8Q5B0_9MICO
MRKTRLMLLTCTAAAIALFAAGCTGGSGSTSAGKKVTITLATNQITAENTGTSPVFQSVIKQFEKDNPNVTIQLEESQATALQQVVQLAFANRKVPDVFNFWRPQPAFNMDKYIASGELGDLTSLSKQVKSEFPSDAWQTATVNGKTWGLPLTDFAVPLVADKAVFTKAGVPLPTTWNLLMSDVKALKAKGIIPFAVTTQPSPQSDDRLFDYVLDRELGNAKALQLFEGKGGSFTAPDVKKALSDYLELSAGNGPSDAAALDDNGVIAKYINTGKAAMLVDNSGYLPSIDATTAKNMVVLPFPTIPGGAETSPHMEKDLTTLMYASSASLKDPTKGPIVQKLLKALTSPASQTQIANNGVLAAATNVKVDPAKAGQFFADVQTTTANEPGDKWLGNGRTPEQEQTFYPLMAQAWSGSLTASSFAKQLDSMFVKG